MPQRDRPKSGVSESVDCVPDEVEQAEQNVSRWLERNRGSATNLAERWCKREVVTHVHLWLKAAVVGGDFDLHDYCVVYERLPGEAEGSDGGDSLAARDLDSPVAGDKRECWDRLMFVEVPELGQHRQGMHCVRVPVVVRLRSVDDCHVLGGNAPEFRRALA